MTVALNTEHASQMLARLITQYKGTTWGEGILSALARQVQEIEQAQIDTANTRAAFDSEGRQLEHLGAIVGRAREGHADPAYRLWLLAQLQINRGSGELPRLLEILRLLVPEAVSITVKEYYPASVEITLDGGEFDSATAAELTAIMRSAKSGGVKLILRYRNQAHGATFKFGSGGITARGFSAGSFAGAAR